MTRSALYEGWVTHRRLEPVSHSFRYRIFMPLLDLDELPDLFDRLPLCSARRPAPIWFRRADFLGNPQTPLAEEARRIVTEQTGCRPAGRVSLLAHPRYLGVGFNPVSFYFVHNENDEVEATIAEVTNTPWGQRRAYVLRGSAGRFEKQLHVSPFMGMNQTYEWSAVQPGERLAISIRNHEAGRTVFEAGLSLRRRPLTGRNLARAFFTHPPMTAAGLARIYGNAFKLKLKGAPYFANPGAASG